jgi:hypothetical protein
MPLLDLRFSCTTFAKGFFPFSLLFSHSFIYPLFATRWKVSLPICFFFLPSHRRPLTPTDTYLRILRIFFASNFLLFSESHDSTSIEHFVFCLFSISEQPHGGV